MSEEKLLHEPVAFRRSGAHGHLLPSECGSDEIEHAYAAACGSLARPKRMLEWHWH